MSLRQKIITARKNKGFTQEELADLSNVTTRTIQRIESGETVPRNFTIKTIATALGIPFQELLVKEIETNTLEETTTEATDSIHFLQLFNLSCFSYIVIPYVHFLIPMYILKNSQERNPKAIALARKIIRVQIYWVIGLNLAMLLTLVYNQVQARYFGKSYIIHYLYPFIVMYVLNVFILLSNNQRIKVINTASN